MPDKTTELAGLITEAMNNTARAKTKAYDTTAQVTRIDDEGQVWVSIPGGVRETPVKKTFNVKPGDEVQVHVGGGRAFIQGNYTSPPTDDTRANQAYGVASNALDSAVIAKTAADSAVESAEIAKEAAQNAKDTAESVHDIAEQAAGDAVKAQNSADSAYDSAISAQVQLGMVEDVVGTLEWIANHGQYELTEDTTVISGRQYFTVTGEAVATPVEKNLPFYYERSGTSPNYVYTLTTDTEVDAQKTYYTIIPTLVAEVEPVYFLSEDTAVVEGKTYYELVTGEYVEVEDPDPTDNPSTEGWYEYASNPVASGLYQLSGVDEAVQAYVSSHLALMDDGLHVINDNQSGYLLISSDSVKIKDKDNNTLAEYGEGTVIGNSNGMHIEIGDNPVWGFSEPVIGFYNGDSSVNPPLSYISSSGLSIPHAVIVTSLQIGEAGSGAWKWVVGDEQDITAARHLKLMWVGGN